MTEDYRSDIDAFELYHLAHESHPSSALAEALLPALRQAFSGALGTSVSNILAYPLDLVVTRLKVQQRQSTASTSSAVQDDRHEPHYTSIPSAFHQIYTTEGGLLAFYPGLVLDTFKSVLDSFFLFLFYNLLRRLHRSRLSAHSSKRSTTKAVFDEIAIGVLAGAATKAMTTPLQNIVTRKQISKVGQQQRSLADMARALYKSKGLMGFYSGYSATLFLTLNPSLCFMFDSLLRRAFVRRNDKSAKKQGAGQGALVFICAAMAKAGASAVTYPLSLAKARAQAEASEEKKEKKWKSSRSKDMERKPANIFLTLAHIAKTEGVGSLYSGVEGEVLKGFFSHGLTMLLKERLSTVAIRLYYAISVILRGQSRSMRR